MNKVDNLAFAEENDISIFVPMTIKRRGGGHATVILPKNATPQNTTSITASADKENYDHRLIEMIVKAYEWQQAMHKNPNLSKTLLAEKEKVTPSYVSRTLRLNLLAPDIIKAIIEGRQPRDLMLQDLMKKAIPDLWPEQREIFGF